MTVDADILLRNGCVITMETSIPQATAVAIKGDRIAWVGNEAGAEKISKNAQMIDLEGACVYPGFIDSHAHIIPLGITKVQHLDLLHTFSKNEVMDIIKKEAQKAKPGDWICGLGWDEDKWPIKELPNASDLDAVSPENPVLLIRIDTHSAWVNSQVLKIAGITALTPDTEGGKIYRDSKGNPAGILLDDALRKVYDIMPTPSFDETLHLTLNVLRDCSSKGITMIHNAVTFAMDFEVFKKLSDENLLPLRIYAMVMLPDKLGESFLKSGPKKYGPCLEVRCIKLFMDGALGSRGAALIEPYEDDTQNHGLTLWKETELIKLLKKVKKKGFQAGAHVIGDYANRLLLDAYEKVGVKDLRWRAEHAQMIHPSDIKRFGEIGVIAAMQPLHATMDMAWIEKRIGTKRTKEGAFAWRSLLDSHAIIAGGSDAPVVDINPLLGIHAAITRQNLEGKPDGGWLPEQRMTREEALRAYTINGAYAAFREHELGSIKPGKLADLVVLPENLLTCDAKKMLDMKVLYTIFNGRIMHYKSVDS